ncbi:MAG: AarF/UbiB family protein, partial [Bacteroidota bacterium]
MSDRTRTRATPDSDAPKASDEGVLAEARAPAPRADQMGSQGDGLDLPLGAPTPSEPVRSGPVPETPEERARRRRNRIPTRPNSVPEVTPEAETERAILAELRNRARRLRRHPPPEPVDDDTAIAQAAGFEVMEVGTPPSLIRRYFTTLRHALGLVYGSAVAVARDREQFAIVKGFPLFLIKVAAFFVKPLVMKDIRALPLQEQLRRRLEMLGPTYIKLGQVLALREDLLPPFITEELKNLLDRLPVMPFPEYLERVAKGLDRPVDEMFEWIDPKPLGSASIGQIHRARTIE